MPLSWLPNKYCEDLMKNAVFRREKCIEHKTEIWLSPRHAKYPLSATNEHGLEYHVTYPIGVPNLVKIGEKLRPLTLTNEKISLLQKSVWGKTVIPLGSRHAVIAKLVYCSVLVTVTVYTH